MSWRTGILSEMRGGAQRNTPPNSLILARDARSARVARDRRSAVSRRVEVCLVEDTYRSNDARGGRWTNDVDRSVYSYRRIRAVNGVEGG